MFQPYVVGQSGTDRPDVGARDEAAGEDQEDRAGGDELGEAVEHLQGWRGQAEAGKAGGVGRFGLPPRLPACPALPA